MRKISFRPDAERTEAKRKRTNECETNGYFRVSYVCWRSDG